MENNPKVKAKCDLGVKSSEDRRKKLVRAITDVCYENCMDKLSDELLVETLIRLPNCESAIRCKCVSNRWLNLISSNFFISRFVWHHHNKNRGKSIPFALISEYTDVDDVGRTLVHSKDNRHDFAYSGFSFKFLPKLHDEQGESLPTVFSISGAHRDLLLLSIWSQEVNCRSGVQYLICNPRTKQWVLLPPGPYQEVRLQNVAFVCEPYYSLDNDQGKCCVQHSYRYRVLSLPFVDHGSEGPKLDVFNSETHQWGKLALSCPQGSIRLRPGVPPVFNNGILHMFNGPNIVAFDPFDAGNDGVVACRLIDLPVEKATTGVGYVGTCSGSLRLCVAQWKMYNPPHLKVWDLRDYDKGEWCLKHHISTYDLEVSCNSYLNIQRHKLKIAMSNLHVLSFHLYDMDILYLLLGNCIVECNMRMGTLEVTGKYRQGIKASLTYGGQNVGYLMKDMYQVFLPWWPTPVPAF